MRMIENKSYLFWSAEETRLVDEELVDETFHRENLVEQAKDICKAVKLRVIKRSNKFLLIVTNDLVKAAYKVE